MPSVTWALGPGPKQFACKPSSKFTPFVFERQILVFTAIMAGEGEDTMTAQPLLPTPDSNGVQGDNGVVAENAAPSSPKKRARTGSPNIEMPENSVKRQKGVAPIKAESAGSCPKHCVGTC